MEILDEEKSLLVFRKQRETECFPIINRGKLWYDCLTSDQLMELKKWYHDWLDITKTKIIPIKPKWLTEKIKEEEFIL
jgi:hypothetical protein